MLTKFIYLFFLAGRAEGTELNGDSVGELKPNSTDIFFDYFGAYDGVRVRKP